MFRSRLQICSGLRRGIDYLNLLDSCFPHRDFPLRGARGNDNISGGAVSHTEQAWYNKYMSHILGIGGFLFRAKNPEELKKWYIETLGIEIKDYVWQQKAGPTVLQPTAKENDLFSVDKQWMINFRVDNLKELIADLKSKNVAVEERDEWNISPEEVGTFARIHDPEGNPIELWQPGEK